MNDLFLKAVILTILAIGLANTSVYNAGAEPFTPTVIPGNLPEIIKQEGIPPLHNRGRTACVRIQIKPHGNGVI